MAPDWTDSPVTIAIMVFITLVVVALVVSDLVRRLVREYRRTQADQPPRRHFHL